MIKKNQHTCRWKVEFRNMAYDMGVGDSWDQYYFTWVGAHISRLIHNHLRSWGGWTKVVRVNNDLYTTRRSDTVGHMIHLDAESHSDGKHIALSIHATDGAVDTELRLDVDLEDAKRFYRDLGEAIERSEVNA